MARMGRRKFCVDDDENTCDDSTESCVKCYLTSYICSLKYTGTSVTGQGVFCPDRTFWQALWVTVSSVESAMVGYPIPIGIG